MPTPLLIDWQLRNWIHTKRETQTQIPSHIKTQNQTQLGGAVAHQWLITLARPPRQRMQFSIVPIPCDVAKNGSGHLSAQSQATHMTNHGVCSLCTIGRSSTSIWDPDRWLMMHDRRWSKAPFDSATQCHRYSQVAWNIRHQNNGQTQDTQDTNCKRQAAHGKRPSKLTLSAHTFRPILLSHWRKATGVFPQGGSQEGASNQQLHKQIAVNIHNFLFKLSSARISALNSHQRHFLVTKKKLQLHALNPPKRPSPPRLLPGQSLAIKCRLRKTRLLSSTVPARLKFENLKLKQRRYESNSALICSSKCAFIDFIMHKASHKSDKNANRHRYETKIMHLKPIRRRYLFYDNTLRMGRKCLSWGSYLRFGKFT